MSITANAEQVPVSIVGGSNYGRYNTINAERTYNMFISDDWLIAFPGYRQITEILSTENLSGRAMFHSIRGGFLLVVVGNDVYRFDTVSETSTGTLVNSGTPLTGTGEAFIDENLSYQICIIDSDHLAYVYNWDPSFGENGIFGALSFDSGSQLPTGFSYNYVTYQNTYFVFGNANTTSIGSQWIVAQSNYTTTGDVTTAFQLKLVQTLALQTKPDYAIACLRIPGAGNNLLIFGTSVCEIWQQVGSSQVYQRQSTINIDYGCISTATIAASDNIICWLAINEKSAPSIMVMTGSQAQRISTDGIDYFLSTIQFPAQSTAFFYRQDGHLFYQLTFYNDADNKTITYDFATQKFFDLTDENYNYHPARDVVYFDDATYFISLDDASLYKMDSDITAIEDYKLSNFYQIPRVRVCDTFRMASPEKFMINLFTFFIESGVIPNVTDMPECSGYILNEITNLPIYTEDTNDPSDVPILVEGGSCGIYKPRIDVSMSKNGGITFSNSYPYYFHRTGHFNAQPRFNKLGVANQITFQLRFWAFSRIVIKNGLVEIRS